MIREDVTKTTVFSVAIGKKRRSASTQSTTIIPQNGLLFELIGCTIINMGCKVSNFCGPKWPFDCALRNICMEREQIWLVFTSNVWACSLMNLQSDGQEIIICVHYIIWRWPSPHTHLIGKGPLLYATRIGWNGSDECDLPTKADETH